MCILHYAFNMHVFSAQTFHVSIDPWNLIPWGRERWTDCAGCDAKRAAPNAGHADQGIDKGEEADEGEERCWEETCQGNKERYTWCKAKEQGNQEDNG